MPFEKGDPNINRKGRPPKGEALTDIARKYLGEKEEGHSLTRKEEFVRKVVAMAYNGDMAAIKMLWNYLDGMPKQKIELDDGSDRIQDMKKYIDEQIQSVDTDIPQDTDESAV